MKFIAVALLSLFTVQSFAFTIECLGTNNLSYTQYDFESLTIVSTPRENTITINGKTTTLGETLPVRMNPAFRMTTQAESLTVISPLELGHITFSAGSSLSYVQNRMELQKYRDTVVTLIDFGKRIKIDLDCQMKK